MAKVTLSKIKDQLSEIQRQLSALLVIFENDTISVPNLEHLTINSLRRYEQMY